MTTKDAFDNFEKARADLKLAIDAAVIIPILNLICRIIGKSKKNQKKESSKIPYDGPFPPNHWNCRCMIKRQAVVLLPEEIKNELKIVSLN